MPAIESDPPDTSMLVRRTRHLRPRLPADLVARSRLVDRLNQGLHQPLVLIATPAGFGKTTLLCDWLAQTPLPSAWLSLDEQGEDLASFVTNLEAALEELLPNGARETLRMLPFPVPPAPHAIAARLADEMLDLPDDVILVLDDYHAVSDARIHEFLAGLLEHPAPGLHVVLATRVDPPLPLARLRARGQMTELRAADLRFTAEETIVFLARTTHGHINSAVAARLGERTEGWAAGLCLAALSIEEGEPAEGVFSAFQGRRFHHVMEFLTDEVLDRQSPEMQDFLLRTSIVDRLCAPLCDVVLAGERSHASSEAMLGEAVRAHLYLDPLGDEQREDRLTWYRYHQLFRDVLRRRLLARLGADGVASLHARASRWFAGKG